MNTHSTPNAAIAHIGSGVTFAIGLVLFALAIVGTWKMFEKAGEGGWKSLVPVYNSYVLYGIAWETRFFFWSLAATLFGVAGAIGAAVSSFTLMMGSGGGMLALWVVIALVGSVASVVLAIMLGIHLAHAFGRGAGWAVGLILLPSVFYMLLGLMGSVSYVGPDGHAGTPAPAVLPSGDGGAQERPHVNYSEKRR